MNNQQAKRHDRIKSAKAIFQEFYLTYQEKDDYWLVAIATNQSLHYYPATGRWRLQDAKTLYYSRSALDFISKVYQRQKG